MNRGSFNIEPNRFFSSSNFSIPDSSKSLGCKVCSLTRVLFEIEAQSLAWEEDLKNKDKEVLTSDKSGPFTSWLMVGMV